MLTITFLGTGAAEGIPNAFCRCRNCDGARQSGGPSLRKRSAALVGDDLLIDLGPHIAHAGNPPHPELAAFAREHGYEVVYDGLVLTV